jgi:biotin carboxylase
MRLVVYITPNFTANTVRFIEALTGIYDIRLIIISQEPVSLLPQWQQCRITISRQVTDIFNSKTLIQELTEIHKQTGDFHRILGASEQLQVALAEVRQVFGVEGMDVETAHNFRDKSRMKLLFEKAGVPCARHALVNVYEQAKEFTKKCPYPLVVKPVAGAGSQATFRVNDDVEMEKAFHVLGNKASDGVIIEEFILGEEYSLDTFSLNGKVLGQTINHYIPTPLEVMSNPWIQWRVILRKEINDPSFDDIRAAGQKALDTLGMKTGLSHMEWFRRRDGSVAISEVAARPPGAQFPTIISRACDFDVVQSWVRLMINNEVSIPKIKYSSGAA